LHPRREPLPRGLRAQVLGQGGTPPEPSVPPRRAAGGPRRPLGARIFFQDGTSDMNVSIIGTGHVGLITGACLAERGHKVLCVDVDERKIKLLKSRRMPIYEPGLEDLVLKNMKSGRLKFGGTNADAVDFGKVIFICVPTPPTP